MRAVSVRGAFVAAMTLALALPGAVAAGDGDDRDPSFSRDGLRHVDFGRSEIGTHLFGGQDGSIYVAGGSHPEFLAPRDQRPVLARLLPDGHLDRSFGDGGGVFVDPTANSDSSLAWARGADRRFIVLSRTSVRSEQTGFSLARLLANGELDRSFGSGGVVQEDGGARFDGGGEVSVLTDDSVLTLGDTGKAVRVARYRPNGSVDQGFAGSGTLRIRSFWGDVLIALPNGRFVVVGTKRQPRSNHRIVLAAFNRHGEPLRRFGDNGRARLSITGPGNVSVGISDASLADGGAIVLAGGRLNRFTDESNMLVARFTAGGQVDTSLSKNGWRTIDIVPSDFADGVSTAPDGRIFLVGDDLGVGSDAARQTTVAAVKPDGRLLRSFANGGKLRTAFGTEEEYRALSALYHQGKLLVAGGNRVSPPTAETGDIFVARFRID